MQDGPWNKYRQLGGQPGVIRGLPRAPDPIEQTRLQLSIEANERAEDADARAARAEQRAAQKAELDIEKTQRELARESAGGGGTEAERTAAFLTTRLQGALNTINQVTQRNPDAAGPEWDATIAGLFSDTAANYLTSSDRQQVESAQLDALDAALTLGTGAAYTREQLEGYRKSYFPQHGDTAETIAQKRANFQRLLQAARVKSGSQAENIDRALSNAGDVAPEVQSLTASNLVDFASGLSGGKYEITKDANVLYNGEVIIPAAEVANSDEFREAYRRKYGEYPPLAVDVVGGEGGPPPPGDAQRDTVLGAIDAAGRGAADVLSLGLADEISAAVTTVFDGGTMADNLRRERAIDATDERVNPYARGAGQIAGAIAFPLGRNAQTPGQLARVGGATGAGYGFGSAEGDIGDRALGAAQTGAAGALGGYAIGRGIQALGGARNALLGPRGPSGAPTQAQRNALAGAAERQNVRILPADVGGPTTRNLTSAAVQGPMSAGPVVKAANQAVDDLQGAVGRQVSGLGGALDDEAAGQAVRRAGERYISNETGRIGRMYERAREMAEGVTIVPQRAVAAIDRRVAELGELGETNAPLINALTKLRTDIAKGVSVSGLRNARTSLSQGVYDGKLRSSQEKQIYREVLDEIASDISEGLAEQGLQGAGQIFQRADTLWKARIDQIDQVLEPLIGRNRSGEDVIRSLNSMAAGKSGGVARLNRVIKEMAPDEQSRIQATVIDRLGRARNSAQDDTGETFSPETFLTRWNEMSPRGKAILFGGGELRRNLDDIAKIASGMRESGRFRNHSNTVGSWSGQALLSGGITMAGGWPALALASASQYLGARALTSPALTRWLARAPKNATPRAQRAYIERLSQVAAREPAVRNEVLQLQQRLLESISVQQRVAADEPDQPR